MMTVSAAVKLMPSPPALVLSRKTNLSESALWYSAICTHTQLLTIPKLSPFAHTQLLTITKFSPFALILLLRGNAIIILNTQSA